MFSVIIFNIWMSSQQMTDMISNARLITSSQTPTVTLIKPSFGQMNKPRYLVILYRLILWLLMKWCMRFLFLLCWRIPQTLTANLGVSPVDTREMQSLCAFLFRDIKSVDVYRKIHTNTAIYMSFDWIISYISFVLSDLDCARITAINNISPSASNGKCRWQS